MITPGLQLQLQQSAAYEVIILSLIGSSWFDVPFSSFYTQTWLSDESHCHLQSNSFPKEKGVKGFA